MKTKYNKANQVGRGFSLTAILVLQAYAREGHDSVYLTLVFPAEDKGTKIESVTLISESEKLSAHLSIDLTMHEGARVNLWVGKEILHNINFHIAYSWCNHMYSYKVPKGIVYD